MNEFLEKLLKNPKIESDITWAVLETLDSITFSYRLAGEIRGFLDDFDVDYIEAVDWTCVSLTRRDTRPMLWAYHFNPRNEYPYSARYTLVKDEAMAVDLLHKCNVVRTSDEVELYKSDGFTHVIVFWNGIPYDVGPLL